MRPTEVPVVGAQLFPLPSSGALPRADPDSILQLTSSMEVSLAGLFYRIPKLMLSICSTGEDSQESPGQQGEQTSQP